MCELILTGAARVIRKRQQRFVYEDAGPPARRHEAAPCATRQVVSQPSMLIDQTPMDRTEPIASHTTLASLDLHKEYVGRHAPQKAFTRGRDVRIGSLRNTASSSPKAMR